MGKASSSKKVARAASTSGGRTSRGRTPWLYYISIFGIVLLGSAMVYTSRHHRLQKVNSQGQTPPVAGKDHWHVAYRFYVCTGASTGKFLPPIPAGGPDTVGIHTHGDSIIHTHPFVSSAAGKNAVLGAFTKAVGVTLNAGQLKVPSFGAAAESGSKGSIANPAYHSHDYRDGDSCGGKPGRVQVMTWGGPNTSITTVPSLVKSPGTLWSGDPRLPRLYNNNLITIAFVPKGAIIPPPPADAIYNLEHLSDVAAATPTTSSTTTPTTKPSSSTTAVTTKPASSATTSTTKK